MEIFKQKEYKPICFWKIDWLAVVPWIAWRRKTGKRLTKACKKGSILSWVGFEGPSQCDLVQHCSSASFLHTTSTLSSWPSWRTDFFSLSPTVKILLEQPLSSDPFSYCAFYSSPPFSENCPPTIPWEWRPGAMSLLQDPDSRPWAKGADTWLKLDHSCFLSLESRIGTQKCTSQIRLALDPERQVNLWAVGQEQLSHENIHRTATDSLTICESPWQLCRIRLWITHTSLKSCGSNVREESEKNSK